MGVQTLPRWRRVGRLGTAARHPPRRTRPPHAARIAGAAGVRTAASRLAFRRLCPPDFVGPPVAFVRPVAAARPTQAHRAHRVIRFLTRITAVVMRRSFHGHGARSEDRLEHLRVRPLVIFGRRVERSVRRPQVRRARVCAPDVAVGIQRRVRTVQIRTHREPAWGMRGGKGVMRRGICGHPKVDGGFSDLHGVSRR